MIGRVRQAVEQLRYLLHETKEMNGARWWRWGNVWFSHPFWVVASYRFERAGYLVLGEGWGAARVAVSPLLFLIRPWTGGCEIHYRADIGPGLRILHPTLGVVVSGRAVIGKNLILVGGNCIGARSKTGKIRLGDNVMLGANASVIGPVDVGDDVKIGTNALVTKDVPSGQTLLAPLAVARPGSSS